MGDFLRVVLQRSRDPSADRAIRSHRSKGHLKNTVSSRKCSRMVRTDQFRAALEVSGGELPLDPKQMDIEESQTALMIELSPSRISWIARE